jgi:4-amino-4-deoxy-L-arabinose transferase-like glycosyltransferase
MSRAAGTIAAADPARGLRPWVLLTILAAIVYLPGIASIPPTDRDEARFIQATRQMMESGDYVRIRFLDKPRHKKPAGAYWLQAAAVETVADPATRAPWPFRLPSILAAWLGLLATFTLARPLVGATSALLGAAIVGTTATLAAEAHLAKADAPLFLSVVIALGLLGQNYVGARRGLAPPRLTATLGLWAALAAGTLIKGPVLPGLFAATVLALTIADRDAHWIARLRPVAGGVVFLALTSPWLIAIQQATDGAFLAQSVGEDILPKLLGAHESHGAPPGFYTLTSFATFWPWSLWTIPALLWAWRERSRPEVRFLLAWLLPSLAVLELAPTKLPHYSLPVFPALALLIALALSAGRDGIEAVAARHPRLVRAGFAAWGVVGIALVAVAVAGPVWFDGRLDPWSLPIAVAGLGVVAVAWRSGVAAMATRWKLLPLVAALGFPLFLGGLFPGLQSFWLNPRLSAAIAGVRATTAAQTPLAVVDYDEPSLVFLEGTDTRLVGPVGAARLWAEDCRTLAVVRERAHPAFVAAVGESGMSLPEPAAEVTGFNYSNGKWLRFVLYARDRCDG